MLGGTWFDPLILGIIVASTMLGIYRGLLRSVAGLLGLILGAAFAGRIAAFIDPTLDSAHIQHPPIPGAIAFSLSFLAIVVAVEIGSGMLRIIQKLFFLGWADRLGGAFFGGIRGLLFVMILLSGLSLFGSDTLTETTKNTTVAVWLWEHAPAAVAVLPDGMIRTMTRLIHDQAPFLGEPACCASILQQ